MAGTGGGATAQSTIPDYVQNMHGLILRGFGGQNSKNWEGVVQGGIVESCVVISGGVDYSVADVLTLLNSDATVQATAVVVTVDGAGGVLTVTVTGGGDTYKNEHTSMTTVAPAGGSGCYLKVYTFNDSYVSSGSYKNEPSILRFLIERGLTDAGGNPYESAYAYDHSTDMAQVQAEADQFKSAVALYNPQSDFDSAVTKALTLASTSTTTIDGESILNSASERALSLFLSMLNTYSPQITSLLLSSTEQSKYIVRGAVTEMMSLANEVLISSVVEEAVEVHRTRQLTDHLRGVNRFAGGMADINAVNGSAFIIGMALLESGFENNVADYRAKLMLELYDKAMSSFTQLLSGLISEMPSYLGAHIQVLLDSNRLQGATLLQAKLTEAQDKSQFTAGAINTMMNALSGKIEQTRNVALLQADVSKMNIVVGKEQVDSDLEILAKENTWDLEMFQKASNVISGISGGVVAMPTGPTKMQSAVAGMFSGTAKGAEMGAALPFMGPTAGATIGGLAGLIAGAT
jgi:hypothetical protein